eukprot:CAMPEP_0171455352 /NCGR_PEP_ID=MMETSP0945-20130129/2283_1 /TAXON_ID=109269 /ORGANISM="Vaucheria litorea, Strain CCMP2940" /LENGTH=871 /DNA_ID=CAMNT_0011980579 /DNA_START=73 /DNA_END=2688 /DNA_ORIENTATION=+
MKVSTTALVVGLAALNGQASTAEYTSEEWATVFTQLTGCLVSFASCGHSPTPTGDPGIDADMVSGFLPYYTKESCEAATLQDVTPFPKAARWFQQFASPADFKSATEVVADDIVIARLTEGASADLGAVNVTDVIRCNTGANFVIAQGGAKVLESESTIDFVAPFPAELRAFPELEVVFNSTGTLRVRLTPSASEVAEQTASRLVARRRLAGADDLTVEVAKRADGTPTGALHVSTANFVETVEWLRFSEGVLYIEPLFDIIPKNGDAAIISQTGDGVDGGSFSVPTPEEAPFWAAGLLGQNQVVGIGDSGLDSRHCFFRDENFDEADAIAKRQAAGGGLGARFDYPNHRKIAQYVAYTDGDEGEVGGHGTHVAGSVLGSFDEGVTDTLIEPGQEWYGNATSHTGMAPAAKAAFFDMGSPVLPYIYTPDDLEDMFMPAYEVGARIHTNSWGANWNVYSGNCRSTDKFLHENQDFVVLFANGNALPQFTTGSVGAPASAKNCLSVGAARNSNRSLNITKYSYGAPEEPRWWHTCGTDDCADEMAFFSSSGPTYDNRIKPDVVAPGFWIHSAQSDIEADTCAIAALLGTSMATPVTAGNTALVRQWFTDGYFPSGSPNKEDAFTPMGALLKAMLVNGAADMATQQLLPPNGVIDLSGSSPNIMSGFGRVQLNNNMLLSGNKAGEKYVFVDGDYSDMPVLEASGDSKTYEFIVEEGASFRATMVYYDAPASELATVAIINDLDVAVESPDGTIFYPNGLSAADKLNTVEQINVVATVSGTYKVTVSASSILSGPQPFAVVVSGEIEEPVTPPGGPDNTIVIVIGVGCGAVVIVCAAIMFMRRRSPPSQKDMFTDVEAKNPAYDLSNPGGKLPEL